MFDKWEKAVVEFLANAAVRHSADYQSELRYKVGMLRTWAEGRKVDLHQFTAAHMDAYLAERKEKPARWGVPVGARSLETDARRAVKFFRFCLQRGHLRRDPLADYTVPRAPEPVTSAASEQWLSDFLRAIDRYHDPKHNQAVLSKTAVHRRIMRTRDRVFVAGLIDTGCRLSELCGLLLGDVDLMARRVLFRQTKNNRNRYVPISEQWADMLREWLKVRPEIECATLFMSAIGEPLTRNAVLQQWRRYERFGGLEHVTRHAIRRYTITQIAAVDITAAAHIAGHQDIRVTKERYVRPTSEALERAAADAGALAAISIQKGKNRAHRF